MLTAVVLILAGVTAWCVASLAVALVFGPMVRTADRRRLSDRSAHPVTGAIRLPIAH